MFLRKERLEKEEKDRLKSNQNNQQIKHLDSSSIHSKNSFLNADDSSIDATMHHKQTESIENYSKHASSGKLANMNGLLNKSQRGIESSIHSKNTNDLNNDFNNENMNDIDDENVKGCPVLIQTSLGIKFVAQVF